MKITMKNNSDLRILIVDDDELFQIGLEVYLEKFGTVTKAQTADKALELIRKNVFDLAFIDLWMDGKLTGLELAKEANHFKAYSVILSGSDDDENISKAYEVGCKDYLAKTNYRKNIDRIIQTVLKTSSNKTDLEQIKKEIITTDEKLIKKIVDAKTILENQKSIYLGGETGTGKTKIAKLIHELSGLPEKNFIHLNCAEIPEGLAESELFGHLKGAFTGAIQAKKGKLLLANNGTLFLDEVATLSLAVQAKLLKALEEKIFYPVGSDEQVKSNFTIISATCENLEKRVSEGLFRQDLYFRLTNFTIDIAPLRERKNDIHLQLKHFTKLEGRHVIFNEAAKAALENYSWPGNTRELKSVAEIVCMKSNGMVTEQDLPHKILEPSINSMETDKQFLNLDQEKYISTNGLKSFINKMEQQVAVKVYEKHGRKIRPTLSELKIASTTLYRILEEAGVNHARQ